MSKNAPDTRNKLENKKFDPKKSSDKILILKRLNVKSPNDPPKKQSFEEFKEERRLKADPKMKFTKKKSKGEIFKEQTGYSLSVARAMNRNGVVTLEAYKVIRKQKKAEQKKFQQAKRSASKAHKRADKAVKKKK